MKLKSLLVVLVSGMICLPLMGFSEDLTELRQKAEQGDAKAQCRLGSLYKFDEGIPQDYKEAVKWFTKAAEQGDAEAQWLLGNCYKFGQGVPLDSARALDWYIGGFETAEMKEGVFEKDHDPALNKFFERASVIQIKRYCWSDLGINNWSPREPDTLFRVLQWHKNRAVLYHDADSQIELAEYYEEAFFPKNILALYWYHVAAKQYHGVIKEILMPFYLKYLIIPLGVVLAGAIIIWRRKISGKMVQFWKTVKQRPHMSAAYAFGLILILLLVWSICLLYRMLD
jgi:hypothetical protein